VYFSLTVLRARCYTARNFHVNFWAHVELDLNSGRFIEKADPLSTPEFLYHMTEPQWLVDHLKDYLALQLSAYADGITVTLDRKLISKLAAALDFPFEWSLDSHTANVPNTYRDGASSMTRMQAQAAALLNRYSQRANTYILGNVRAFTGQHGKRLLIVIFDPYQTNAAPAQW
jgi:hypothetical protein